MKDFIVTLTLRTSQEAIGPERLGQHQAHLREGCDRGLLRLCPLQESPGALAQASSASLTDLVCFLAKDPILKGGAATYGFKALAPDRRAAAWEGLTPLVAQSAWDRGIA